MVWALIRVCIQRLLRANWVLADVLVHCRNHAIADYLQSQGLGQTLETFKREAEMVSEFVCDL